MKRKNYASKTAALLLAAALVCTSFQPPVRATERPQGAAVEGAKGFGLHVMQPMSPSGVETYSNASAQLKLSGFETQLGADGEIQVFMDAYLLLTDAFATAVGYGIQYDPNCLYASRVRDGKDPVTGVPYTGNTEATFYYEYFEPDPLLAGALGQDPNTPYVYGCVMDGGTVGFKAANILMLPSKAVTDPESGDKIIENRNGQFGFVGDPSRPEGIHLGRFSFHVSDRAALAAGPVGDLIGINAVDGKDDALTGEWDGNNLVEIPVAVDSGDLGYSKIPQSAQLVETNVSVRADEVYQAGTYADLIDMVNTRWNTAIVEWTDATTSVETVGWGTGGNFTINGVAPDSLMYEVKGGTYTLAQDFGLSGQISMTVVVTPVSIIGYQVEPVSETYPLAALPAAFADLHLPAHVAPVLDVKVIPAPAAVLAVEWEAASAPGAYNKLPLTLSGATGYYQEDFTGYIDGMETDTKFPWATTAGTTATAVRYTGDATATPQDVTASVDDTGVLTIRLALNAPTNIPAGTEFELVLQNGMVLDTSQFSGTEYTVSLDDPTGGLATITIDATDNATSAYLQAVQRLVNLGVRAGEYTIVAKELGKGPGAPATFDSQPRNNYYLNDDDATPQSYEFDFSGDARTLFPVGVGDILSKTITLPPSFAILTTYDGVAGKEPGALNIFTVTEWSTPVEDVGNSSIKTITGTLADVGYSGYGMVKNPNAIQISLTYEEDAALAAESIDTIADVQFSTRNEGYTAGQVPAASVTITNTGQAPIGGLNLIFSSAEFDAIDFPAPILAPGKSTTVQLRPALGLAAGVHTATVTVGSNRSSSLGTFELSFEVRDPAAGADDEITALEVRVVDGDTDNGNDVMPTLYRDNALTTAGFDPAIREYYVRVGEDVEKIKLWFETPVTNVSAEYSDNSGPGTLTITLTLDGGKQKTDPIAMLTVDATRNGGFNNTVTLTVGTEEYKVHVQRLQPVTLALGYGNSPYGEIMKDAAITDKNAAKAGFDNSDGVNAVNLQFAQGYIPAGVQTGMPYTTTAWRSYNTYDNGQPYNGDKDETAIFVYQGADFRDPGFKVINQLGQEEAAPTAAVSFTLKKYTSAGLVSYTTAVVDETFTATGNGELYSLAGMMIRPDVYEVTYTYSYTDLLDGTAKTETVTRRLIVLCKRGDIGLSTVPAINATDVNNMKKNVGSLGSSSFNSLVAYRVLDVASSTVPAINATDVNNLSKNIGSIGAATAIQYYRGL